MLSAASILLTAPLLVYAQDGTRFQTVVASPSPTPGEAASPSVTVPLASSTATGSSTSSILDSYTHLPREHKIAAIACSSLFLLGLLTILALYLHRRRTAKRRLKHVSHVLVMNSRPSQSFASGFRSSLSGTLAYPRSSVSPNPPTIPLTTVTPSSSSTPFSSYHPPSPSSHPGTNEVDPKNDITLTVRTASTTTTPVLPPSHSQLSLPETTASSLSASDSIATQGTWKSWLPFVRARMDEEGGPGGTTTTGGSFEDRATTLPDKVGRQERLLQMRRKSYRASWGEHE